MHTPPAEGCTTATSSTSITPRDRWCTARPDRSRGRGSRSRTARRPCSGSGSARDRPGHAGGAARAPRGRVLTLARMVGARREVPAPGAVDVLRLDVDLDLRYDLDGAEHAGVNPAGSVLARAFGVPASCSGRWCSPEPSTSTARPRASPPPPCSSAGSPRPATLPPATTPRHGEPASGTPSESLSSPPAPVAQPPNPTRCQSVRPRRCCPSPRAQPRTGRSRTGRSRTGWSRTGWSRTGWSRTGWSRSIPWPTP